VIHAWAPWVWGTTIKALYKSPYLLTLRSLSFDSLFVRSALSSTKDHSAELEKHRCNLDFQEFFSLKEYSTNGINSVKIAFPATPWINTIKGKEGMMRRHKTGFFKDDAWSDWSYWPHQLDVHRISVSYSVATPHKWAGKYVANKSEMQGSMRLGRLFTFTVHHCTRSQLN